MASRCTATAALIGALGVGGGAPAQDHAFATAAAAAVLDAAPAQRA